MALGETLLEIAGPGAIRGRQKRIRRLKDLTGAKTLPHLVYLLLAAGHLAPVAGATVRPKPDDLYLPTIELLAHGHTYYQIGRKLCLNEDSIRRRITVARRITRTKTRAHLVMICWSKDYIV